ncbi:amino acid adenylation domain-containing protein [Streptomyces sp. NPDC004311]|uniref:non-ribosomal peptide synthetase n=1 Tax=Streptomyces sp. NPDC004311 TaxID=3364698 RepID=UPI00369E29E6
MTPHTPPSRQFWHEALTAGNGFTPLPRWTRTPVDGTAEHETVLPPGETAALRRLAEGTETALEALVLTAHAKVLAALSGEREVTTGYVTAAGGPPLPFTLATDPCSWTTLARRTAHAVAHLHEHRDFPLDELRHELGLTEPLFETVLDLADLTDLTGPAAPPREPAGHDGLSGADTVLRLTVTGHDDGRLTLRLRYRTDALDADCAARIAGYHRTALALMAAAPDADHTARTLLSQEERHYQLHGLAGPSRALPERRFHELFEQRVRQHPQAVAAQLGDRTWTYGELNSRANRLAHALRARGLRAEGVVAVAMERDLDWLASVLAVLKAGGVYLPVEPHLPAARVRAMLDRAGCGIVLTRPASAANLRSALDAPSAPRILHVDTAYAEEHPGTDLGIDVAPDQLAYIYFTSGSTGEPKGAMCEHQGMLNHLYAKIDDLEIGEGQVVAQTAPQCFDISLWQLLAALLVGGRTLLVEQETVLDVARFVDTVARERVAVLQVVPSYLDVVVSHLERHPRTLPDLRYASVTGEPLKKELAQRWFTAQPHVRLVNAYGLTETSDDTNHEVMDRVPDTDRVPLGRPVNNVHLYVVDENLDPVPLGAPGVIAFSGVCVGRGYVNDPERTRPTYLTDPHRAGSRLYRSGDLGRWQPDGKLEFLGRRDHQVKIRGFRIETGEIENTLLRVPGVRDSAVVVAERPDRSTHLVAFYSAPRPLDTGTLLDRLGAALPAYMIPSALHWREALPLTPNSKIDRKALTLLATRLPDPEDDAQPPRTDSEQRLAAAWARVLGVPRERIDRREHFFDRGGTSLSAVRLAVALDRAVTPADVSRHPVLADLARFLDTAPGRAAAR